MDLQKREQFAVGLRREKKAQLLQLKRKLLFAQSGESSTTVFAGSKPATQIESEEQLSDYLDSLPSLFENRDQAIFEVLNSLQELSEEAANYSNPRYLVF